MTLPDERYRSVTRTRDFLLDICTPAASPRVPSHIRDRARALLKHFPTDRDLDTVAEEAPEVFSRNRVYFSPPVEEWPKYEAKKKNWMTSFLYGKNSQ